MEYSYNRDEILKKLTELKDKDVEAFTDLVLKAFRIAPDHVLQDPHPSAHKLRALTSMLDYLETTERFEDCAFIKGIMDKIETKEESSYTICGACGGDASICDGC
jgi:hypothetical protein